MSNLFEQIVLPSNNKEEQGIDVSRALFEAHKRISNRYLEEKRRTQELNDLEDRLYKRIMKDIDIQITDKATPAIEALNKQLLNLGKRR